MSLAQVIERIRSDGELAANFAAWRVLPAQPPSLSPFPDALDARLKEVLRRRGIERLYTPPGRGGRRRAARASNVVVVTPTASGKTLCYNLPVLQTHPRRPRGARPLPLPDQGARAGPDATSCTASISDLGVDIKTFTYDGDTPGDARRAVRAAGHIVVTNPDMLHTGILPHHTKWVKLFENLRYVVIDELHQYRGVFGSHVANVIRRLRRICRFYGSDPVFICCSATIANPGELAQNVCSASPSTSDRRQRRAARARSPSPSTTRRSSTASWASGAGAVKAARAHRRRACCRRASRRSSSRPAA